METDDLVFRTIVFTLAGVMVAVVIVLLAGLFSPTVDNDKVFAILGIARYSPVVDFGNSFGITSARVRSSISRMIM